MKLGKIAGTKPIVVSLIKNIKKAYCTCGLSDSQPFCDGSHIDTEFEPMMFKPEKTGKASLCTCKRTLNPPYCDGAHKHLDEDKAIVLEKNESNSNTISPKSSEPYLQTIRDLAENGLNKHKHGTSVAMGVPITELPRWDEIQILTAQLARKPLMEDVEVNSKTIIGPNAAKPLELDMPIFISDMSFGALSKEAKISLARGAELARTGICSGEGGMLPEEKESNSRYFYEYASGKFGFDWMDLHSIQAFHLKCGQAAKTGIGGHLPAEKVTAEIAKVRGVEIGKPVVSPPTFTDLSTLDEYAVFVAEVKELSEGIPVGFKISANHIEDDIQFAIDAGADYIILDGRGGGTGSAPQMFRDNISVPTIPALARARRYLDSVHRPDITLVITGGLRTASDFIKALALGADAVAISSSALHAIGCMAAKICHTNTCPAGIATQDEELRKLLDVDKVSENLGRFLSSSNELMKMMARACGHKSLSDFNITDLTTWKKEMTKLSGIKYGGVDGRN